MVRWLIQGQNLLELQAAVYHPASPTQQLHDLLLQPCSHPVTASAVLVLSLSVARMLLCSAIFHIALLHIHLLMCHCKLLCATQYIISPNSFPCKYLLQ